MVPPASVRAADKSAARRIWISTATEKVSFVLFASSLEINTFVLKGRISWILGRGSSVMTSVCCLHHLSVLWVPLHRSRSRSRVEAMGNISAPKISSGFVDFD